MDLETLKRYPRREYALPPDFVMKYSIAVDAPTWDAILAALERAEQVEAAAREVLRAQLGYGTPLHPRVTAALSALQAALAAAPESSDER